MTLAMDVARMVNCLGDVKPCGECNQCRRITDSLHADVRIISLETEEGKEGRTRTAIRIEQIRDLQKEASLKPYEGRYRVFIVDGAELMTEEASNGLLKTLEEPPDEVIFVLLASEVGAILPTIVSRCQRVELRPLPLSVVADELEGNYKADHDTAQEIARLSGGKPGWALDAMQNPKILEERSSKLGNIEDVIRGGLEDRFAYADSLSRTFSRNREAVFQELRLWLEWWRDALVVKGGAGEFVTNLSRTEAINAAAERLSDVEIARVINAIQDTTVHLERNVNARLALEQLMLALPRI